MTQIPSQPSSSGRRAQWCSGWARLLERLLLENYEHLFHADGPSLKLSLLMLADMEFFASLQASLAEDECQFVEGFVHQNLAVKENCLRVFHKLMYYFHILALLKPFSLDLMHKYFKVWLKLG